MSKRREDEAVSDEPERFSDPNREAVGQPPAGVPDEGETTETERETTRETERKAKRERDREDDETETEPE